MSERDPKPGDPAAPPAASPPSPPEGEDELRRVDDDDPDARFVRSLLQARRTQRAQASDAGPDAPSDLGPSGAPAATEGAPEGDAAEPILDEVDVREMLRSALAPPKGAVAPELLRGVQRRIRVRSQGKFYGDGWSTARSPRSTYLVTSLLMLALIVFVFFVLIPWGGATLP